MINLHTEEEERERERKKVRQMTSKVSVAETEAENFSVYTGIRTRGLRGRVLYPYATTTIAYTTKCNLKLEA